MIGKKRWWAVLYDVLCSSSWSHQHLSCWPRIVADPLCHWFSAMAQTFFFLLPLIFYDDNLEQIWKKTSLLLKSTTLKWKNRHVLQDLVVASTSFHIWIWGTRMFHIWLITTIKTIASLRQTRFSFRSSFTQNHIEITYKYSTFS